MKNKELIINEMNKRKIEYFVHFTDVRNIPSILAYGLLTRDTLNYYNMDYSFNDDNRIDNISNSISLSVSFPNYKMFYLITLKYPTRDYCVFFLDAFEVIKYDCIFNKTNAASNLCRSLTIEERMTFAAFNSMFADSSQERSRDNMKLASYETTDPQAEILVKHNLPVSCIKYCFFKNSNILNQYKNLFINTGIESWYNGNYFFGRHDYEYWR